MGMSAVRVRTNLFINPRFVFKTFSKAKPYF